MHCNHLKDCGEKAIENLTKILVYFSLFGICIIFLEMKTYTLIYITLTVTKYTDNSAELFSAQQGEETWGYLAAEQRDQGLRSRETERNKR